MMLDPELVRRVLDFAVTIQQIPAPTFHEAQRSAFVQTRFQAEGLQDVSMDDVGNVIGRLPGEGRALPLLISAHTDTVFPLSTNLQAKRTVDRIYGPGIGDNSLGVAGLFGLLWAIRERDELLPGDLWLVANVGEEGLGNLRGMRKVVERFGDRVLAYIVLEGMALGQIYHRALGVRRYRISVETRGGHSWVDFGRPSAVHELAALITRLSILPLPDRPRTTLNVGVITGGTSVNTIAAQASLELDLRSEGVRALEDLVRQVEELVQSANQPEVQANAEVIGERPVGKIPLNHPLIRLAKHSLEAQGVRPNLSIGSTDANVPLSQGLPAVCLGLSNGGGAHTVDEYINCAPLVQGLGQVVTLVEEAYHELGV